MSPASNSIPRIRLLLPSLLYGAAGGLLGGCAVLPDWTHGESREVSVLVDYQVGVDDSFVVMPASNTWLKVLVLHTRPETLRESFMAGQRRLHVPPDIRRLQVLCRYKLYPRRDEAGRLLPWPTAAELFPGAARIRHATEMTSSDFLQE